MTETSASTQAAIRVFRAVLVVAIGVALGWFVYGNVTNPAATYPFKLGLDLAGGAHLVYEADTSDVQPAEVNELMGVLRDVIERRVNIFGVSEPVVYVEESSFVTDEPVQRLVVELPGVSDVSAAVAEIGRTPLLEFKLVDQEALAIQETIESFEAQNQATSSDGPRTEISNVRVNGATTSDPYLDTDLTGRFFERAEPMLPQNNSGSGGFQASPYLTITFNNEGADLFEQITRDNVGEQLAIFLDGELLSAPTINEAIPGGTAIITGNFTAEEVRELAENLNFGALPLPIELASTQTVGATLGAQVLEHGISAGMIGLSLVIAFMLLWYRVPGLVAAVALLFYVVSMLALFQFVPVVLTAAGLAGFVLSLGMAVDANVLVFERMKEEYRSGKDSRAAARDGFARAWSAIRDGNITSILSAVILFWFGTSIVKGFALVFGLGVILSMLTALTVTRTLLIALPSLTHQGSRFGWLYNSGFKK
ncbi:protein translocase subunit SecD [bacterium]|nr:protein translocase subunit SecD [bacterium]